MSWYLQQINGGEAGSTFQNEWVACPAAPAADAGTGAGAFVCTFGDQQHFAYVDNQSNLQDCFYDGDTNQWNLQQINGGTPTVTSETVACQQAPALLDCTPFLCSFDNQLHFTYFGDDGNLYDCFRVGGTTEWNLWQITGFGGALPQAPTAGPMSLFVCPFGNQLHFTYLDENSNLQDCIYDSDAKVWKLQQITGAGGACPQSPSVRDASTWFVSPFGNQLHFAYVDDRGNLQDCWYDGGRHLVERGSDPTWWYLQQITGGTPTVANESVACAQAPAAAESFAVYVFTFGNQQHFTYLDKNLNLQDCWYDGDANQWNLQQINGGTATVKNEYVACPTAPAVGNYGANHSWFACSFITAASAAISPYLGSQQFAYLDGAGNLQNCFYDGGLNRWDVQQITGTHGICPQAPAVAEGGVLFLCPFGNQLHFTYQDVYLNLQDIWTWQTTERVIQLPSGINYTPV